MASRVALVVLVVALVATAAVASYPSDDGPYFGGGDGGQGLINDVMDQLDQEMLMESESARRQLGRSAGHIGYGALARNRVPCNRRGQSYYNCNSHQRANPYRRGCTRATRCARSNR